MKMNLPNLPNQPGNLPESHLKSIRHLEAAYLRHDDPIRQSGFSGGLERWRSERSPLLDAIDDSGDFLDLGCANGYLLESVVEWAQESGIQLNPHGGDMNPLLVQEAIRRFPDQAHQFWVCNAWGWMPPIRFKWIYAIWDLVPIDILPTLASHLLKHALTQNGTLILGAYGSKSADESPLDIAQFLRTAGFPVAGEAAGGRLRRGGPVTRFAWIRRRDWC